jgi:poly(3-hydroxybutyrate) depolymerase
VHSGLPAGSAHDLMSGLNAMKGAGGKRKRHGARPQRPVPAIVFHGDQDAVVHPSNGHAVVRQFAPQTPLRQVEDRGQCGAGRGYTRTMTLDDDDRVVAEHWVVHGAGHAWAGGSTAGSYADPAGPGASAEMLRFFLAQPRP